MSEDSTKQSIILTYSVLVGLTPLVPLPFVDDLLKVYFRRRMVRSLATKRAQELGEDMVRLLAKDKGGVFLLGCLSAVFIYPLKKAFRKVFFFLEWKRAVDLTSQTYHYGYLLDFALRDGWIKNDANNIEAVRAALDEVCRSTPIKPVESVVGATFNQTKGLVLSGVEILERAVRPLKKKPSESEITEAVEAVEEEEKEKLEGITSRLQRSLANIPEEHFKTMREKFVTRMKESGQRSQAALESAPE